MRVWNWPVLPVMPCVTTRVFLLIRMDIAFPSLARDGGDDLLRGVGHVVGGNDRQPRILEDLPADLVVGALHAHHQGHRQINLARRGHHALGDGVALQDAAEAVDQYPLDLRILAVSYTHLTLPTNREV